MRKGDVLPDLIIEITPVPGSPAIAATVSVPTAPSLPDSRQPFALLGATLRLLHILISIAVCVLIIARDTVVNGWKHSIGKAYGSISIQVIR